MVYLDGITARASFSSISVCVCVCVCGWVGVSREQITNKQPVESDPEAVCVWVSLAVPGRQLACCVLAVVAKDKKKKEKAEKARARSRLSPVSSVVHVCACLSGGARKRRGEPGV